MSKDFIGHERNLMKKNSRKEKPKIIAISNQKGGEGKTTISIFLAEAMSQYGKTLLVDWDAQANSTRHFLLDVKYSIFDCLGYRGQQVVPPSLVIRSISDSLDIFPASISLANFITPYGVEDFSLLDDLLKKVSDNYKYVFIDCPPSLGLTLENALIASEYVIIPIQTRAFSVQGLSDLSFTIEKIKKKANSSLKLLGAVFNQYEQSRALSGLTEGIKKYFPVFKTSIPRKESIPQAQVKRLRLKECEKKIQSIFFDLAMEVKEKLDE
jgi:chromosome partitioning protein